MAAHRTTSTTHWLNSIQSETDIIRPPQLPRPPALLCCGKVNQLNKAKSQLFVVIGKCRLCTILENCTVCTEHSLWLPNWIFYSVCIKSLVCLLKMDASVLGVKKVQIRYKKSKKEKAVILDTVCKMWRMCIASTAVYLTYIQAAEAASMLDVLLSYVLLCVFNVQSVSNLVSSFSLQST